jgi:hypothetical protein
MAERYGAPSAFLLVDGYDLVANKVHTLTHKITALMTKSDGLGDEWEEHSPTGVSMAEITQEGAFFDTAALKSHAALKTLPASPQTAARVICLGFATQWKGKPFMGFEGVHNEDYTVIAARGELTKANCVHKVTGAAEKGQIIQEIGRAIKILTSSVASPSVITTAEAHGIADGQTVRIAGHTGSTPDINNDYVATVISTTTFSVPENVTVGGTGGTVTQYNSADWTTENGQAVDYTLDINQHAVPILTSSVASPTVITTSEPHGLTTGQIVLIAGHSGSTPDINGEEAVTVVTTTTFTVVQNVTVGGTGGTIVQSDSVAGGYGFQQVTALTGLTGFVGTIRDSADDITYLDLLAFANVTAAPAAERKVVAGTVDRYLAFDGDVTGTGVIVVFCGFSRS